MKYLFDRRKTLLSSPRSVPWILLLAAFLAYGLFFWRHGFYWDDLPITWIRYELGREALTRYFSTARPVWAVLYQVTTTFLPPLPMLWQVVSILWRWLGAVLLWQFVRKLWKGREGMAALTALLFLLYPGFNLQWAAFLTTHFWIVVCFFLASYLLTLRALQDGSRYWLFTLTAMLLSALNLWMLEYFYSLEFIRLAVIFYALWRSAAPPETFASTARRSLLLWLPYLLVFTANVLYRMFVFTNTAYQNVFFAELRAHPLNAVFRLAAKILSDLWLASGRAFGTIFLFPHPALDGKLTVLMYAVVVILTAGLAFFLLRRFVRPPGSRSAALWAMGMGLAAMLLSGGPYWLASLEISLAFPASRFTMSFMLGVSLFVAGLLELMPRRLSLALAVTVVALSAGRQVMLGESFLKDWQSQRSLFWQMFWRAPALKPDTLILMNEELAYYADNSISAAVNWIYDPAARAEDINYVLFYPTNRLGRSLSSLTEDVPVHYSYIAGDFNGNTSDTLAFYYHPPACLRLLEPDLDPQNRLIPAESLMREASALSNAARIIPDGQVQMPPLYFPEPPHGWCYYFQKADLARQVKDWAEVARLGDIAFQLDDYPNDPLERFVFIEGYAHVGQWDKALEYSRVSYRVSKEYVAPLLCRLWKRIEAETAQSPREDALSQSQRSEALAEIQNLLACTIP